VDLQSSLQTLLPVAAVAVAAPLLLAFLPRVRIPQVVLLLFGGMLIGPQALRLGDPTSIQFLADVGLGFVFLLAGYEVDPRLFGRSAGRRAIAAWVTSAVLALGVVALLGSAGLVRAFVPVALGLTTTALGTLLPILRESGMLRGRLGENLLAAGAVGELFPILVIALFLGISNRLVALASLLAVAVLAVLLAAFARLAAGRRLVEVVVSGQHETTQTTLRATVLLLVLLLVVTDEFHLDAVLGAFVAGMVLRRWAGGSSHTLEEKLDAVGYGFFIPIFFIYSGMSLDLHSIASAPLRVLMFLGLMLAVRGLPTLLVYRGVLDGHQRVQTALVSATALPLLVALTEIGLRNGTMLRENAAALVGAGVLTVLVFPAAAVALQRSAPAAPPAGAAPELSGSDRSASEPAGDEPDGHGGGGRESNPPDRDPRPRRF
jgi:Kef-type K+ transport system membrane component KefB